MNWVLSAMAGIVFIGIPVWFVLSIAWVAKGESDVNGDPERDAKGGAM